MKVDGDDIIFETTGRKDYANAAIIGLRVAGPERSHHLDTNGGYDGGFPAYGEPLTRMERIELGTFMVQMWGRYIAGEATDATD